MAEQPVNLSTAIYLGVFSRAEQRVVQAIFKAIAEGGGRCVATLAMLPQLGHQQVNHAQRDRPSGGNRPSRKDRASLLLRGLASQHSDLRAALMREAWQTLNGRTVWPTSEVLKDLPVLCPRSSV